MSTNTIPINPLEEDDCKQLWNQFEACLIEHELDACMQLLNEQANVLRKEHQRQFIEYCRSIVFIELNQWDRAERLLIPLQQEILHPALRLRVLNERAIANEHLGHLVEAMELYEAAMKEAELQGDELFWAKVTKNRAICAIRLYETKQIAEEHFLTFHNDLKQIAKIFQARNERLEEGRAWNELGAFHKALGQWQQAISCYEQDLVISREQKHQHGIAACLNNIGEAQIQQKHYAQAESVLHEAIALFADLGDPYEQADALVNLGHALAAQEKQSDAAAALEQAITCVESVRSGIGVQVARMDFFATQTHVYGAMIDHCLQQGNVAGAFHYTERSRARGLLEMVAGADVRIPATVPESIQQRERELRRRLAQAIQEEEANQTAIEQELEQLHRELQIAVPEYASFREVLPTSVAQIANELPSDTAVLSYFVLDNRCIAFVASPVKSVSVYTLPFAITDLVATSFDSRGQLRSILAGQGMYLPRPWLLERLYTTLIAPLLDKCRECQRLLIIPHGPLYHLPLHAAYDKDEGVYLCEKYDIVYAPSTTIQTNYLRHKTSSDQRAGVLSIQCGTDGLMHPCHEVQTIAELSGGHGMVGAEATLARLLELAEQHRYLHFAGHAWFRKETPMLSGIDLADQRLTAWDILQLPDLGFALVSVNGCESGLSQVQPGDELLGLLRALLYSVAPSVLLALWPIEDLSARIFAQLFYRTLLSAPTTTKHMSRVLRETVQAFRNLSYDEVHSLLESEGHSDTEIQEMLARLPRRSPAERASAQPDCPFEHPYFWAGYLLVGEVWEAT